MGARGERGEETVEPVGINSKNSLGASPTLAPRQALGIAAWGGKEKPDKLSAQAN